jgi:dUTP pyrophosphatase
MKVQVINKSKNELPQYAHKGDAGMDLRADFSHVNDITAHGGEWDEVRQRFILFSGGRAAIPTGLFVEIPNDCYIHVQPRSGLAIKNGVTVLNTPGLIDSNYRGEICVILVNLSDEPFEIKQGDRIAQAVLNKYQTINWEITTTLEHSDRGTNGFGSSGV